jgi:hypothetical protein
MKRPPTNLKRDLGHKKLKEEEIPDSFTEHKISNKFKESEHNMESLFAMSSKERK